MTQDPRTVVRSSTMLWGSQVSQVEALELMDMPAGSPEIEQLGGQLEALRDRRRPWIYVFGIHRTKFVQPHPVYS